MLGNSPKLHITLIRVHLFGQSTVLIFLQIPLGCLPKNESLNEDMVDILEHHHHNYVPMSEVNGVKTPADFVCFGGDQLTEERSETFGRHGQMARVWTRN